VLAVWTDDRPSAASARARGAGCRAVAWRGVAWHTAGVVRANACTRHGRREGQPPPTPAMDLELDLDLDLGLHALCFAVTWIRLRRCLRSGWLAAPTPSRLPDGEMLHFCFHSHLPLTTDHSPLTSHLPVQRIATQRQSHSPSHRPSVRPSVRPSPRPLVRSPATLLSIPLTGAGSGAASGPAYCIPVAGRRSRRVHACLRSDRSRELERG
jgi:hypothetical protein